MFKTSRFEKLIPSLPALGLLASLLAGCTLDSVIVLKHPASVPRGGTFAVGTVDIILDVTASGIPADSVFRDSIHVGVGLPAGWEVLSAKVCAAPHFRPAKASVNNLDTNLRNQLLLDSLGACESRAVDLAPDAGVEAFLLGRSIRVNASPDSLGPRFNLRTDTVPAWAGFGGRIEVRVPAGQPADTILDTTAFKALPVYVYFSIKAPEADTTVCLLYFSKTGKLDTNGFGGGANQDRGGLVYRPITVGSPVALHPRAPRAASPPAAGRDGLFHLRLSEGHHVLALPAQASAGGAGGARLEVRGSSGAVLRSWTGDALRGAAWVHWDGTDRAGLALPSGRYVLVLFEGGRILARPFPLLR